MLIFGGLLQGEDPTLADIEAATEVAEEKVHKPARFIMRDDLVPGDFETPGMIENPHFVPAEDTTTREDRCRRCGTVFLNEPVVWKEKVVFRSNSCPFCSENLGAERAARCPMRHPELILRPKFTRGQARTWNNFEGYVLKKPVIDPISTPLQMAAPATPPIEITVDEVIPPQQATAPEGHAKHGPSSLKHKEICAHWRSDSGTNPVAEEGTMLHERLVTRDFSGLEPQQELAARMVADLFDDLVKNLGPGAVILREHRLDVAEITWGTADLVAFSADRKRGVIADAKFGWIEVDDAETNLQGQCYTVGAWTLEPANEEMTVVFAQPRCDMVSSHTFYRSKDYDRLHSRAKAAVDAANNPDSPFHPDPENCKYCGAKGTCEALLGMAKTVAPRVAPEGFKIPEHLLAASISDPEMMAQALVLGDILEQWASSLRERAREMLAEGTHVPGYELGERQSPRSITSTELAWEAVKDTVSAEEFAKTAKTVSIGKLEEVFAAAKAALPDAKKGVKSKAKQELEDRLTDLGALKQEGVTYYLKPINNRKLTEKEPAQQLQNV
jgi:hypothetical protein